MARSLAGTRIRQRRRTLNLRQTDLAEAIGISPSYLNLIEHNRRGVTPRILKSIAEKLKLKPSELAEGAESALEAELRELAAQYAAQHPEIDNLEELIGRFPGWARLLAMLSRQAGDHAAALAALTERMNYDPQLQNMLHDMLTNITAIRSTAGILVEADDVPDETVDRFQQVIQTESRRLSATAQELVTYFDRAVDAPKNAATPQEAVELFLERNDYYFPTLETPDDIETEISRLIGEAPELQSTDAQNRIRPRLRAQADDAAAMPLDEFLSVAQKSGFSPSLLSRHFRQPLHRVFCRLAVLKRGAEDLPAYGLVIINAAGHPLFRRPLPEFSLPRFSAICALWPVFEALSQVGNPIEEIIVLPDGREFLARAIAEPMGATEFGQRQPIASAMLVTEIGQAHTFGMIENNVAARRSVGSSCRLCPRDDCIARSEPNAFLSPD